MEVSINMNITYNNTYLVENLTHFYPISENIDLQDAVQSIAYQIPKSIMNIFVISALFFVAYYYILPIWERYFKYSQEAGHFLFVGGLSLLLFGIVNFIYYLFPQDLKNYGLMGLYILVMVVIIYWGSKWLMKRRQQK